MTKHEPQPTLVPSLVRSQPSRSVWRVLVLVVALALYNYASDVVWDKLGVSDVSWESPWKLPLLLFGSVFSCVGVVGLGCVVWGKTSLRELGWTLPNPGRLILVGLGLGAVLIALVVAVYRIMGGPAGIQELSQILSSFTVAQRLHFAVAGVKIAFVEESVFRGDLIRTLTARMGSAPAVIVAALIFSLWHRSLDPLGLFMKAVFGVLMGLAAVRTKSLVPSAIAHAMMWAVLGTA